MSWSKAQPKKITSWSFSRYGVYAKCPAQAKYKFIDKLPEPGSPAMERGSAIHDLANAYTKGVSSRIPAELRRFEGEFRTLRAEYKKGNVVAEENWAFRADWSRTVYNDWNGCVLRVKLDAAKKDGDLVSVIDHKTGKFSPQWNLQEYVLQLDLYALAALYVYEDVGPALRVVPQLWYLDHGITYPSVQDGPKVYEPADRPRLRKEWEARVKPMLADTKFKPKPGNHCGFCAFSKSKGGPCAY